MPSKTQEVKQEAEAEEEEEEIAAFRPTLAKRTLQDLSSTAGLPSIGRVPATTSVTSAQYAEAPRTPQNEIPPSWERCDVTRILLNSKLPGGFRCKSTTFGD
ncbi:uncharacterized protein H6S33_003670 [Morchella sextelata]|uniref:uncharacterized protein n=1 Tax=Morchella sextelata TaxID=1174677 RepID=UPI001D0452F7|nr:uncharacterized protein H6S33_003670 [Morchella sextelata]KAH0606836.1 hypothetical protein H6S33_003670 [Morchella sextelata]